ncbi:Phospholipase A I [Rhizoctonia solani]|uniref:Phospholipase A I n=1 Tax=Rhizoctonia solani TaxID=456999 RepID=A0A0K6GBS7_9AGAM|nr:Phospholipase A I [Rhizoctonia solani]
MNTSNRNNAASSSSYRPHTRTVNDQGQLRLLCFDGGGVRGLSSLFILKEFLHCVQHDGTFVRPEGASGEILPCDYFDMICGTSTGGLIAIMLGKLRMSVTEAIEAYARLSGDIFSKKKWFWKEGRYSARALEKAINTIVGERVSHIQAQGGDQVGEIDKYALGRSTMMRGDQPETQGCKVFVCAINTMNADAEANIRTYRVTQNELDDFAIWEAARATTAAPYFFKPLETSTGNGRAFKAIYVDGGVRHNNPMMQLLREVAREFPNRSASFILSLGTGQKNVIQLPRAGFIPKLQLFKVVKLLQDIATDCEQTHQDIERNFTTHQNIYFRFNVDQGMQGLGLEEWQRQGEIGAHTRTYTGRAETTKRLNEAVTAFINLQSRIPIHKTFSV